jgi:hypothetical protein
MARILRGLSSRLLPCGCLLGIYETYEGTVVGLVDAKAANCAISAHSGGNVLPVHHPDQQGCDTPGDDDN